MKVTRVDIYEISNICTFVLKLNIYLNFKKSSTFPRHAQPRSSRRGGLRFRSLVGSASLDAGDRRLVGAYSGDWRLGWPRQPALLHQAAGTSPSDSRRKAASLQSSSAQVEVAKSMGQFAAASAVDAGILLGDNFYDSGVRIHPEPLQACVSSKRLASRCNPPGPRSVLTRPSMAFTRLLR